MTRVSPQDRLAAVANAATDVFGRLGYRGTRTAAVAAAAGLSTGALFTYVESKEALFHLVFAYGFGHFDDVLPPLPLPSPAPGETLHLIEQEMRKVPVPRLRSALEEDAPSDAAAELRGIVAERYDMLARLWPMLAVIERCAAELPELETYYFKRARVGYFSQLTRYLEERAGAGYLRTMPDAAITARILTETLAWFAWKRHQGRDAHTYDDALVKRNVIEFLSAALVEVGQ
jgi:AcrR family transcriptional regulator